MLSAMVSKLKVAPPAPETEENTNKAEGGGEKKKMKKTAQEPSASSEKEQPKETQARANGIEEATEERSKMVKEKEKEEEGEGEDSDIEVQMRTRRHSLHESKVRSQELDRSLVEMRCRHNRKVAVQLRQKIQKDRSVFRKLNHYLQVNEDLSDAAKWVEKIKYNSEMKRCGLMSSSEEEEEEIDREERSKEIERDVRDFIRRSLEKHVKRRSLSASDCDQIEERATRKVMSKHSECKTSAFLGKKGADIRKLLDKYLLAFSKNKKGKQTHKHAPIPPPPPL